jgi:hypothetical protein
MSTHAEDINIALLSNRALCTMLEEAEQEERSLSDRRRELHTLIDARSVHATNGFELGQMRRKERELSTDRLQLHQRILELRLEKSRRIDRLRTPLRAVESSDG